MEVRVNESTGELIIEYRYKPGNPFLAEKYFREHEEEIKKRVEKILSDIMLAAEGEALAYTEKDGIYTIPCPVCGKSMLATRDELTRGTNLAHPECLKLRTPFSAHLICAACGKHFRRPSSLVRNPGRRKYCSWDCLHRNNSGPKHWTKRNGKYVPLDT